MLGVDAETINKDIKGYILLYGSFLIGSRLTLGNNVAISVTATRILSEHRTKLGQRKTMENAFFFL